MKTICTLTLLFILQTSFSQTYGETVADTDHNLTNGYVTYWPIVTGPADSGVFTDIGFFDDPGTPSASQVRMALYDHDAGANKPDVLLAETAVTVPIDGTYNLIPLLTSPTLLPNTTYWIAFKGNGTHACGERDGYFWPFAIKYRSASFATPWPPTSGLSTIPSVVSISLYVVGNGQFVVPVEMLRFEGSVDHNQVSLTWETATETNNSGWEIQRSQNGYTWSKIDWMDGSNNTHTQRTYHYTDKNPLAGANFYRLKQMDHDGQFAYSDIIVFRIDQETKKLYPNPVRDYLYHEGYEGVTYGLFDINGKMILNGIMKNGCPIDMSPLPSGPYQIFYYDGIQQDQSTIIKE